MAQNMFRSCIRRQELPEQGKWMNECQGWAECRLLRPDLVYALINHDFSSAVVQQEKESI
jgi:hypothetical protein